MKVSIKIKKADLKRHRNFIKNQPKAFRQAIKIGLLRIGLEARGAAASKAPYKTGTLRRSLTSKNSNAIYKYSEKGGRQQMEIGSNLVYARIQEFGGRTGRGGKGGKGKRGATVIRARNFLTPQIKIMRNGRGAKILGEEVAAATNKIIK